MRQAYEAKPICPWCKLPGSIKDALTRCCNEPVKIVFVCNVCKLPLKGKGAGTKWHDKCKG